jgi:hypothetical protein
MPKEAQYLNLNETDAAESRPSLVGNQTTKSEVFIERKKLPHCHRKENLEDFGEE